MASNTPSYTFIDATGLVTADTADIKETVQNEFKGALGDNLSLEDSTPQGRLIDIETDARVSVLENNAMLANSFNVMMAYGTFLDAILANFGLYREGATSSSVVAVVSGVPGTVIPANSQASTSSGVVFYAENQITIPDGGTTSATFLSLETGEIACAANSLTRIIDGTFGWETINNPSPAVLGTEKESDASVKTRYLQSGLYTGATLVADYQNAVNKVANVKSTYFYDNDTSETVTIDGVNINAHSIYCCVDGGNADDVAQALFSRKSPGCGYTGNTKVNVTDSIANATYEVSFDFATQVPIYASITVSTGTAAAPDLEATIKQAFIDYSNGNIEGFSGFKVGGDISAFEIAAGIGAAVTGIVVQDLKIGTISGNLSTAEIPININQVAQFSIENITVTIND